VVFEETPLRYLILFCFFVFSPHSGALEINQATEAELDNLRGLGPAFTRRVLAARSQQPFKDWPDLMRRVSGMGPRVARKLSEQGLTVQGQVLSPGLL
jgi:competence protein ComEA